MKKILILLSVLGFATFISAFKEMKLVEDEGEGLENNLWGHLSLVEDEGEGVEDEGEGMERRRRFRRHRKFRRGLELVEDEGEGVEDEGEGVEDEGEGMERRRRFIRHRKFRRNSLLDDGTEEVQEYGKITKLGNIIPCQDNSYCRSLHPQACCAVIKAYDPASGARAQVNTCGLRSKVDEISRNPPKNVTV